MTDAGPPAPRRQRLRGAAPPPRPRSAGPRRWRPTLAAALAAVSVAGPACGRGEFEDRTAKVTVDGRTTTFELDACGLDEDTLFVVGRASDGSVLQAVVAVEEDRTTGIETGTGVSVSLDDVDLSAFGAESWARRQGRGDAPGQIREAGRRGSRIQVAGALEPVDADGAPAVAGSRLDFALDARCDEDEG